MTTSSSSRSGLSSQDGWQVRHQYSNLEAMRRPFELSRHSADMLKQLSPPQASNALREVWIYLLQDLGVF